MTIGLYSYRGDWIVGEIKDKFVNVRFTPNELVKLDLFMELEGYKSRSKFIRTRVLNNKGERRVKRLSPDIEQKLAILTAEIKRIGNNYNQVVKAVNTAVSLTTKGGNPVVSTRSMEYQLSRLRKMMQEILDGVAALQ